MNLNELAESAKSQLSQVTGLKPVTVTGTTKDEQGWHVSLDMLEMSRIPPAADVLGSYDVLLDDNGHIVQFERKRTRLRGETVEEKGRD
ncbi:MAG: gas vesicle protein [Chloroflexi bacterium]|nr:gas vesicle protein [Chloroflexota bacterium]MDA8188650.1 gas vesicle protein [Dehalococcoidales bacterium]